MRGEESTGVRDKRTKYKVSVLFISLTKTFDCEFLLRVKLDYTCKPRGSDGTRDQRVGARVPRLVPPTWSGVRTRSGS